MTYSWKCAPATMGYLRFNSNGAACGRGTTVYDDGRRIPLERNIRFDAHGESASEATGVVDQSMSIKG